MSEHDAFESVESAIKEEKDIYSSLDNIAAAPKRILVEDTDMGKAWQERIKALSALADAYRKGIIRE